LIQSPQFTDALDSLFRGAWASVHTGGISRHEKDRNEGNGCHSKDDTYRTDQPTNEVLNHALSITLQTAWVPSSTHAIAE
jgi:hypothetical protein